LNLYAESSAVLAWLMGESSGEQVRRMLSRSPLVLASELTLIECDRVLIRAVAAGYMSEADGADRQRLLKSVVAHWNLLRLEDEIVERARRFFPREPIRTLDAIHIASALFAQSAVGSLVVLSLDERIRACARALGFPVSPE
jgi:predicted nucleic acid-binding protein